VRRLRGIARSDTKLTGAGLRHNTPPLMAYSPPTWNDRRPSNGGRDMSQPYDPANPGQQPPAYPPPPPPQQGGFPPPQQPGFPPAPPPQQGGYPAAPPPQQGGYPPPGGNYPPAPGYGAPPPPGYNIQGPLPPLPPGTELATAGRRIGTYLLDILLAVVTLGIGYLIWAWGFTFRWGQTPAKQLMGLRTYKLETQRAATWGTMFLRQVIGGIVNSIAYIGLIASFVFLFSDEARRTVPDRIAGTIILSDPNKVLDPRGPRQ
jgi:uncharacterized RDD family membrane protein YckC